MKIFFLSGIILICLGGNEAVFAQPIARLTVHNINESIETPVSIDLDGLSYLPDSSLVLRRVVGNKKLPVSFQVEHGYHRFLWWTVSREAVAGQQTQVFELAHGKPAQTANPFIRVEDEDGALVLSEEGKKLYNIIIERFILLREWIPCIKEVVLYILYGPLPVMS